MLLVKNGNLVNTLVGALPQGQIEAALKQIL
jgi:thioredoxin-like negative regulator of GroEL